MDDLESVQTISGKDVIMAYTREPRSSLSYVQHYSDRRVCTCVFWSRYTLFVFNFLVWAAGVTMIGLGTWVLVNGSGLELFETLLTQPSWMLIGVGIVMVIVGMFGCAGALRLNVICLRVYMVLVVAVFILQLVLGAVVLFMMDDIQVHMLDIVQKAVVNYGEVDDIDRDKALDYLQREFKCCGGSSYSDWEANIYYNCSSWASVSRCGVPSSCCRGTRDKQCGYGVREGTEEYTEMFVYSEGCIVSLMKIFKDNVKIVSALAFSVSFIQICCLVLVNIIVKNIVFHRKLIT